MTPAPALDLTTSLRCDLYPPPPLRKHGQGQKNNGHTGSPCLGKPVLARDAQHKETLHTENLPVPHTKCGMQRGGGGRIQTVTAKRKPETSTSCHDF